MTLEELKVKAMADRSAKATQANTIADRLADLRGQGDVDAEEVLRIQVEQDAVLAEARSLNETVERLDREIADDAEMRRLAEIVVPTEARKNGPTATVTVGQEARTYRADTDKDGIGFASDVIARFMGDFGAGQRLDRHMTEERVERGEVAIAGAYSGRAVGTGAFTGIVVPSYLVGDFAMLPRADRPLADVMRKHALPATGMNAYIGKLTTGTSAAEQASENSAVSETDADDTLLTIPILTAAGSQTVSRQASERGIGVEDTIISDLYSAYRAAADSLIINRATTGLTNVATNIAYTDASPTAAELYPKLLAAPAAVEAAMLNAHPGDVVAVMHSRRWYWMQSQLTSTWPLFGQVGVGDQRGGEAYAERYGAGFRGLLPSGVPVVVDNNINTLLGAATNEDEIYFVSQTESHLYEDANAPVLIRAEQPAAKTLGINLVVYGYLAYIFTRVSHAQKISGTGLVVPVFA